MNRSGEENRSVRNTKRRLREGLLRLLEQKPINEISVKELTELVDVNRGTFYFHYQDIYDLLRSMEDEFFEQFDLRLSDEPAELPQETAALPKEGFPYLRGVFSFLGQNRDFCRIMLGAHGDMKFVERVKRRVDSQCRRFWQILAPGADELRYVMYNAFIINGCIGMIQEWLSDSRGLTADDVAALTATIVLESVVPSTS